jgi:hypothetical protein
MQICSGSWVRLSSLLAYVILTHLNSKVWQNLRFPRKTPSMCWSAGLLKDELHLFAGFIGSLS